jgi:hypothetical protein
MSEQFHRNAQHPCGVEPLSKSSVPMFPRFAPAEERLTADERHRLVWMAPLFDLSVRIVKREMILSGPTISGGSLHLPLDVGYARLLAELASATIFWVPYGPKRPPESYLLRLPDEKICRMADLRRRKIAQAALAGCHRSPSHPSSS